MSSGHPPLRPGWHSCTATWFGRSSAGPGRRGRRGTPRRYVRGRTGPRQPGRSGDPPGAARTRACRGPAGRGAGGGTDQRPPGPPDHGRHLDRPAGHRSGRPGGRAGFVGPGAPGPGRTGRKGPGTIRARGIPHRARPGARRSERADPPAAGQHRLSAAPGPAARPGAAVAQGRADLGGSAAWHYPRAGGMGGPAEPGGPGTRPDAGAPLPADGPDAGQPPPVPGHHYRAGTRHHRPARFPAAGPDLKPYLDELSVRAGAAAASARARPDRRPAGS